MNHEKIAKVEQLFFAVFATDGAFQYVKVGTTCDPERMARTVCTRSPFRIQRFAFYKVPSESIGRGIEKSCMHRLANYRDGSGWYRFRKDDGTTFVEAIRFAHKRVTGKAKPKWNEVPAEKLTLAPLYVTR